MDHIHEDTEEYNTNRKRKILIVVVHMIADVLSNKKFNLIVTELLIRARKLNISLIYITHSFFAVPKNIRLNSTHCFTMKIPNKWKLQQIVFNHSSDIDYEDFMNLSIQCIGKQCPFLVIDTTLASGSILRFRKSLWERIKKLIMAIDDKTRDEKLQYDIKREAAKTSALSSGKIDKYEHLTFE